ncbi:MAG: SUMF1/EgtB/PvdO family nonheme iron enzyme [Planctomycetota bacterium]
MKVRAGCLLLPLLFLTALAVAAADEGKKVPALYARSARVEGVPVRLYQTPVGTSATIAFDLDIPKSDVQRVVISLAVDDVDAPSEARIVLNGAEPLQLPGDLVADLGPHWGHLRLPLAVVKEGRNEISFTFADDLGGSTAGFDIPFAEVLVVFASFKPQGADRFLAEISHENYIDFIRIPLGFFVSRFEVRQSDWKRVTRDNPFPRDLDPVPATGRTWDEWRHFVDQLNNSFTGVRFAVPNERQWLAAARAGTDTSYFFGDDPAGLSDFAWFLGNATDLRPVGMKKPNPWGLFDVHGNAAEWCADMKGNPSAALGGSWYRLPSGCAFSQRHVVSPADRPPDVGVRLIAIPIAGD